MEFRIGPNLGDVVNEINLPRPEMSSEVFERRFPYKQSKAFEHFVRGLKLAGFENVQ